MTITEAHVASFHIEAITAGDCAVLRVAGEIDVYTAPDLRQQVIDLADNGTRHIVADLRGVDFLDSTGLGALVGSLKRLRLRQGSLGLVISGGRILQLLVITGLTNAFAIHASVLDAISDDQHWQVALAGEGHSAEEWCRKHERPQ
jgi:anti-sigma B factor antagonist